MLLSPEEGLDKDVLVVAAVEVDGEVNIEDELLAGLAGLHQSQHIQLLAIQWGTRSPRERYSGTDNRPIKSEAHPFVQIGEREMMRNAILEMMGREQ